MAMLTRDPFDAELVRTVVLNQTAETVRVSVPLLPTEVADLVSGSSEEMKKHRGFVRCVSARSKTSTAWGKTNAAF